MKNISTHLFDPFEFPGLRLKNRIVMPAMTTNFGNPDGSVSQRLIDYYTARAGGGAGLLIVEPACVDYPRGKGLANELDISTDKAIPGLKKLADAIKKQGAAAAIQLHHAGWSRFGCGPVPVAPVSPSPLKYRGVDTPDVLSVQEIKAIVGQFIQAGLRAKASGFEAVEIHGAHGYLIAQFLSPRFNQRTDDYGGTLDNRARFLLDIIKGIRKRTPHLFPILCRIDADEFADGGITINDSRRLSILMEKAGATAVHVSVNSTPAKSSRQIVSNVPPMGTSEGPWVDLAAKIKEACSIPVVAVGNIRTFEFAQQALASGQADLVGIGRPLIADPMWPEKMKQKQSALIRPCIGCNTCIHCVTRKKSTLVCAVNASAGREAYWGGQPADHPKRVLVIGGGPAGMEAALTAAGRGHHVALWERDHQLGGQLHPASAPPGKKNLLLFRNYLQTRIENSNVTVCCNVSWNLERISDFSPHVCVVAIGSKPGVPWALNEKSDSNVVSARAVLSGEVFPEKKILIAGGGAVGCETADYLCRKGCSVYVVEQGSQIARDMDSMRRRQVLSRLEKAGVKIRLNTRVITAHPTGVEIASLTGQHGILEADSIINACEPVSRRIDMTGLSTMVPRVYTIGDAMKPRGVLEAVMEGHMIGQRI